MSVVRFLVIVALSTLSLVVVGCDLASRDDNSESVSVVSGATTDVRSAVSQPSCDLTPSKTEGPFYFDAGMVRRDITEGKPGTPLLASFRLVDADSCAPIPGAFVDIWHTDADGLYSGYRGQGDDGADTSGQTFLRGKQITDADGLAEFDTIYPGAYPGRTIHIHFKAYTDERRLLTSQMHFPDEVTDVVFQSDPYSEQGSRDTTNERDRLVSDDSEDQTLLGQVTQDGDGYHVSLTISVSR